VSGLVLGCAAASRSDSEITTARVLIGSARFGSRLDQAAILQPPQNVVERARGRVHATTGPELNVLADGVAMRRPIGEGEKDLELEGAEGGHCWDPG
jgi:hypothetical protein